MSEVWRAIPSCDGYEASSLGRVRRVKPYLSTYAGRILTPRERGDGYFMFAVSINGKRYQKYLHRVVCEAFHGPAPLSMAAAHLSGIKSNNRPENIAWATDKENEAHKVIHGTKAQGETCGASKLTAEDVLLIRSHLMYGERRSVLCKLFGVAPSHMARIANRQTWNHLEF